MDEEAKAEELALPFEVLKIQWASSLFMPIYYDVINQVILYGPTYGSEICCFGPRPWANTADKGPITGPI